MTRTRQADPFAGKEDYSNMGRSIASYQLVHRNANLLSKWRPRYESSFASQSHALVGNEIGSIARLKPETASPSQIAAILTPSDTSGDVELSKQHQSAQRKWNRHGKKKLRISHSKAPKFQSTTTTAVIPENTIEATQKIEPNESRLCQQRTVVRKRMCDREHKMDLWQQALAKAAKAAEDGPVCYHLLLEQLDIDRARGY